MIGIRWNYNPLIYRLHYLVYQNGDKYYQDFEGKIKEIPFSRIEAMNEQLNIAGGNDFLILRYREDHPWLRGEEIKVIHRLPSILDVPCTCSYCGWSGTVWDCIPDIDGDGGLGCPVCKTVIEAKG